MKSNTKIWNLKYENLFCNLFLKFILKDLFHFISTHITKLEEVIVFTKEGEVEL